jgi:predicted AAA+ superfamily ATPase
MKKEIKLSFISNLESQESAAWDLIQVIIGPRQVGKTTGIQQYLETQKTNNFL